MNIRILIFTLLGFFISSSIHTKNTKPVIHPDGYIKLATNWGLCGSILIKPITQMPDIQIKLKSVLFSDEQTFKENLGEIILDPQGLRAAYRWGLSLRPDSHYRIYCLQIRSGIEQEIPCQEVIIIDHVKHNVPCVIGPAGPGGSFKPLNMK